MPDSERLLAAIDAAEEDSYGSDSDSQLANDRGYAIGLYLGKNYDPVMEGRSSVVDRSVFEIIDGIVPSLCRIFAGGDKVVDIPAVGEEDEAGAKQETEYLNHVVTQKNNWFEIFLNWSTDALLTKNAYCMAYKDVSVESSLERYENQTEAGLAALLQDKDVEIKSANSRPDENYEPPPPQPMVDPMTGQPAIDPMTGQMAMQPPPPVPMLYDIELRRKSEKSKICLKVLPPERCKVSEKTPSWRLADSDYFEFEDMQTISQLRSEGFDVDDDIPSGENPDTEEDQARDLYKESEDDSNKVDPSMRRVKVRTIWIKHDYDEDGIAELLYVVRVGKEILYQEEVSRIPVACIVPKPLPHRHMGLSVADLVSDIQRINTAILRQGLDNLFLANNSRHAISDKVNLEDMLMARPGGLVRIEQGAIPANEIMPLVTPFIFPQAMEGLEYMNQVRGRRTGVDNSFQGLDANQLSQLQPGTVNQISSMAAQRVEMIARIIATGVEDLFSIVHELILKSGHQKETIKLLGKWVEIDPSQWKKRTDFRITVAYAAGNKDALLQKLMAVGNFQKEAMMGGMSFVQDKNVYETGLEMIKAMDLTSPSRFLTPPEEAPQKQPPQPDVTVMAAENIKSQTALKSKDMDVQQKERDSVRDFEIKKLEIATNADLQLTTHRESMHHAGEVEKFKAHHATGLKKMDKEPADDPKVDQVSAEVADFKQQMGEAIQSMQKAMQMFASAKKQIRRDKNGRAEGVDTVAEDGSVIASQRVVRGPDNRVVGTE